MSSPMFSPKVPDNVPMVQLPDRSAAPNRLASPTVQSGSVGGANRAVRQSRTTVAGLPVQSGVAGLRELTDEQLKIQKAAVRGQIVSRLEKLWEHCQEHQDAPGMLKPDPRYTQISLAVLRELTALYGLKERATGPEEPPLEPVEERVRLMSMITAQVEDLEKRSKDE